MGISASPLYYSLVGAVFKLSGFAFVHSPVPSTPRVWLPSPHLSRQALLYLIFLSTFGCCGYDCMLYAFQCFLCIGLFSTCRDRLSRQCSFYSLCFLCILVWCVLSFVYISPTYVVLSFVFVLYFVSISPPVKAGCLTGAGVGVLTTPGCRGSSSVSCVLPNKNIARVSLFI